MNRPTRDTRKRRLSGYQILGTALAPLALVRLPGKPVHWLARCLVYLAFWSAPQGQISATWGVPSCPLARAWWVANDVTLLLTCFQ
jgi:hypothetical protein